MVDSSPSRTTVTAMRAMPTRAVGRSLQRGPEHLTRRPAGAGPRTRLRRAAELIEFAILLPIFLYMIIFAIDMGNMVMMSGIVHDAAFVGAQAGAQLGGGSQGDSAATSAARGALALVPGVTASRVSATIYDGYGNCNSSGNANGTYIELKVTYPAQFITPGLGALMSIISRSGNNENGAWSLSAVGVARCEIARS